LSAIGCVGNQCFAFADGQAVAHPGSADLVWNFFEQHTNSFQTDPAVKSLPCPMIIHVIGRNPKSENAQINGSYRAIGAIDGRPVFLQPGTQKLIRFSAKSNRWLIQCEGPTEPSLLSKAYHWLFAGGCVPEDRCNAFAEDCAAPHPGFCDMQWQVWEDSRGVHGFDPSVRCTVAPLAVQVLGREPGRENGEIGGDYVLCGTHCGRPAYSKPGTTLAIRYWAPMSRWVIDVHGLRNSDCCCAFVDDLGGVSEDPTLLRPWHVYASSRGCHVPDPGMVVVVPESAPRTLVAEGSSVAAANSNLGIASMKRGGNSAFLSSSPEPPTKRRHFAPYGA